MDRNRRAYRTTQLERDNINPSPIQPLLKTHEPEKGRNYNQFALDVGSDSATRNLFEGLVADEEHHFDEYGNENNNIERFGDSYLAQQAMENSRKVGTPEGNAAR
uniref:Uncharacterized protein n=1 Tax=Candidatus Kentrum sp. LFY TaxID=2126342 RepID=A0A450UH18_9GAMM|nr:MAG: hypothetical protein BECKLFY1418A_GA0070994_101842 [Candidatus Kentron sp. LFY]